MALLCACSGPLLLGIDCGGEFAEIFLVSNVVKSQLLPVLKLSRIVLLCKRLLFLLLANCFCEIRLTTPVVTHLTPVV